MVSTKAIVQGILVGVIAAISLLWQYESGLFKYYPLPHKSFVVENTPVVGNDLSGSALFVHTFEFSGISHSMPFPSVHTADINFVEAGIQQYFKRHAFVNAFVRNVFYAFVSIHAP